MDRRTTIEAGKIPALTPLELWRYRELFFMLAWRNVIVRYKQTLAGVVWALARPLATMAAFSVIFGRVAKLPGISGVPYPMLVFSGVLIWQFFSGMISSGCDALVNNRGLVTKVYFPRVIIPVSGIIVCLIDFLLAAAVFFVFYAVGCRRFFSWRMIFFPFAPVLLAAVATGLILLLSAVNVKYRDFRNVVPFLIQLGLFISPVGFAGSAVPERWRLIAQLNPIYGVINIARWSLFGAAPEPRAIVICLIWAAVLPVVGFWVFRRQEKNFADYI